jgi:hypothetical protein
MRCMLHVHRAQPSPTTLPCLAPSNFCVKAGLTRTAEAFEAEWYELKATGRLGGLATSMPDVYLRNGVGRAAAGRGACMAAAARARGSRLLRSAHFKRCQRAAAWSPGSRARLSPSNARQELEEVVAATQQELVAAQEVAARASATWDK